MHVENRTSLTLSLSNASLTGFSARTTGAEGGDDEGESAIAAKAQDGQCFGLVYSDGHFSFWSLLTTVKGRFDLSTTVWQLL